MICQSRDVNLPQVFPRPTVMVGPAYFSPDAIRYLPPLIHHLDVEGKFIVLIP